MSLQDRIGAHGEFVFQALVTRMCYRRFYFHAVPLGEKHPTADMLVELVNPTGIQTVMFVQVKATARGYAGIGPSRRLEVDVTEADIQNLKRYPGPTYLSGIDILSGRGYIGAVVDTLTGPLRGLPVRHPLNCRTLRSLWKEADAYWNLTVRPIPMVASAFLI